MLQSCANLATISRREVGIRAGKGAGGQVDYVAVPFVTDFVRRAVLLEALQQDPAPYTSHSLRAGFAPKPAPRASPTSSSPATPDPDDAAEAS